MTTGVRTNRSVLINPTGIATFLISDQGATAFMSNQPQAHAANATHASLANSHELTFYVDDLETPTFPATDGNQNHSTYTRSLNNAIKRAKCFTVKDVIHRQSAPHYPLDAVEIRILEWCKGHTGSHQFLGSASYYNPEGSRHLLGIAKGTQAGTSIFTHTHTRDDRLDHPLLFPRQTGGEHFPELGLRVLNTRT